MSVAITKQTITGTELPTDDLTGYLKDPTTGVFYRYLFNAATGEVTRQALFPFPPTAYTEALTHHGYWASLASPSDATKAFATYNNSTPTPYLVFLMYLEHGGGNNEVSFITVSNAYITGYIGTPNLLAIIPYGTIDAIGFYGLGIDRNDGPQFRITAIVSDYTTYAVVPINILSQYCLTDSSGVLSFGYSENAASIDFLLNNVEGYAVRIGTETLSPTAQIKSYIQYYVPPGGEIKQFGNGYYLATNSSGGLFLYSIESSGTLISELSPGTYSSDLSLKFFDLV